MAQAAVAATVFEPMIVERGQHHRVWETITVETDENGEERVIKGGFTELATGLHYLSDGQWQESVVAFEIGPNGHAIASKGQHLVILAPDINSGGSVDLLLPDGVQRLRSNPMGLSYFDTASGQSVLLAEVTNTVGTLIEPNVVLFDNCFDTIRGALRYTYTRDYFEQDVIVYENVGSPADYGLSQATTRLEMFTEFFDPPEPNKSTQTLPGNVEDETLKFGSMRIGRGKAYFLGNTLESADVGKTWQQIDGRDFLVESVHYTHVAPMLQNLQASNSREKNSKVAARTARDRRGLVAGLRKREKSTEVASIKPGRMPDQCANDQFVRGI